ncbi:MAG TPA: acyl carrier protein [Rhodanobacteraceae bacterium]|nr:acyl carrier protein [Rhodanobacteraceae bacterium]
MPRLSSMNVPRLGSRRATRCRQVDAIRYYDIGQQRESIVTTPERIRAILKTHGRLERDVDALKDDSDLYQAGMTSQASVNVLLAVEGEFDVEFPDRLLKRKVFESIAAIACAVDSLTTPINDPRDASKAIDASP